MFEYTIALSLSKTAVTIKLPPEITMTALEMEEFMRGLAVFRANMLPAQLNEDPSVETPLSSVPSQRWYIALDPDEPTQIRLYVQHMGFGWIWLPLAEAGARAMIAIMEDALQHRPRLS